MKGGRGRETMRMSSIFCCCFTKKTSVSNLLYLFRPDNWPAFTHGHKDMCGVRVGGTLHATFKMKIMFLKQHKIESLKFILEMFLSL